MEYQKLLNFLDNRSNHPSKFKTKNWAEINDAHETYCTMVGLDVKIQC